MKMLFHGAKGARTGQATQARHKRRHKRHKKWGVDSTNGEAWLVNAAISRREIMLTFETIRSVSRPIKSGRKANIRFYWQALCPDNFETINKWMTIEFKQVGANLEFGGRERELAVRHSLFFTHSARCAHGMFGFAVPSLRR